jgi:hypothetical protein
MKKSLLVLLSSTCLLAPAAFAGEGHDHSPKHGGITQEVGTVNYELVARADTLSLYLSAHGAPYAATGAKAEAVIHSGNVKTPVTLTPAGDNTLTAKGSFKTGLGVRVTVSVTLPNQPAATVNFRLK